MKRNIAYVLGIMLLAASCISEQGLDVNSTRKDEVKFVADMKSAVTKTLYGADHAKTIKVKWVNGDQIKVFGTDCAVSTGEYQITEAANKPNVDGVAGETIADALTRLGDVGVQWGSEKSSDFVAVYPAENASFQYNENNGDVTISTTISSVQNYVFDEDVNTEKTTAVKVYGDDGNLIETRNVPIWEGTHFANDATNPSMLNAIMYARTDNVSAGSNVSLSFEPFSTVLKFRFEGFTDLWDKGTDVYIQSITIEAPSAIAGNFDITVPRGVSAENPVTAKATGSNSNIITINTIKAGGSYLKITANQAVEFNVFTLPLSNMTISETSLWTVSIQVQGVADPYKYKMIPTAEGGYKLVPGLVHKVKIPALKVTTPPVWTPGNWITQIPKPVYISELSVPGAWYCTDSEYQGSIGLGSVGDDGVDVGLKALYNSGVRAFNIDCRLTYANCNYPYTDGSGSLRLVCAGSDKTTGIDYISAGYTNGDLVKDKLSSLAKLVRSDEYIVVVLTIAEKPLTRSGTVSDSSGDRFHIYGTVDPAQVLPQIATVLNDSSADYYSKLYKKKITSDTVVEDVLGSMIVKVNSNTSSYSSYFNAPALISYASMALPEWSGNNSYGINNVDVLPSGYYGKMNDADISWGNTGVDLEYYYHQAQRTTRSGGYWVNENVGSTLRPDYQDVFHTYEIDGVPSYNQRKKSIDDIITKSKGVYDNAHHNVWFQMGIGGTRKSAEDEDEDSDRVEVADTLNTYLLEKINAKMAKDPSPVGLVLMNHCISKGGDLTRAIIEMNGKFYLNRKGNDVITGGGEQNGTGSGTETKASAYVGPDAF